MRVVLPVGDFFRGGDDERGLRGREEAEVAVHLGRRSLEDSECADHRAPEADLADLEVLERTLGLRAPIAVGRDRDLAHRVFLCSRVHTLLLSRLRRSMLRRWDARELNSMV